MKRLAFAFGVLAPGFTASAPARADYSVVKFESGYCQIWWDSGVTPWGVGWTKIVVGLPDFPAAWAALNAALTQRVLLVSPVAPPYSRGPTRTADRVIHFSRSSAMRTIGAAILQGPILTFASGFGRLSCECSNERTARKYKS